MMLIFFLSSSILFSFFLFLCQIYSGRQKRPNRNPGGLLAAWNAATSKADLVVAQDGSGSHKTINEAVAAVGRMGRRRPERVVIHVKAGVYNERVEIGRNLRHLMFVGDGMDKTIVTGSRNVVDGATTLSSATFGNSNSLMYFIKSMSHHLIRVFHHLQWF